MRQAPGADECMKKQTNRSIPTAAPRPIDGRRRPTVDGEPALSRREHEIHGWLAEGKRDSEIAKILGISVHTVRKHVQHIFEKLRVENRTAAALLYVAPTRGRDGASRAKPRSHCSSPSAR